jgi:hypothetical protein
VTPGLLDETQADPKPKFAGTTGGEQTGPQITARLPDSRQLQDYRDSDQTGANNVVSHKILLAVTKLGSRFDVPQQSVHCNAILLHRAVGVERPLLRREFEHSEGWYWPVSDQCRRPAPAGLDFSLFRHLKGIINLNPKISHCAFKFGVAE